MWKPKNVERALFMWGKWRGFIIEEWSLARDNLAELTVGQIRERTGAILRPMGFPDSLVLEMYWICCVVSDYVIDDHTTYRHIVVPSWLRSRYAEHRYKLYYHVRSRARAEPPEIWDEQTLDFEAMRVYRGPAPKEVVDSLRSNEGAFWIFLPSDHELYEFLDRLRGRPKTRRKPGKPRVNSDRLAVKCAVLKYNGPMTYVEVASKLGLPITINPDTGYRQSETARHLVKEGRKLIETKYTNL